MKRLLQLSGLVAILALALAGRSAQASLPVLTPTCGDPCAHNGQAGVCLKSSTIHAFVECSCFDGTWSCPR
jgi:hypothetical protein